MLKGSRRAGKDHRRSHFTARFKDRPDRFGVVNIKMQEPHNLYSVHPAEDIWWK